MKDPNDTQTQSLIPEKRKRGRPKTGTALTPAEKQARYRERKAQKTVTVTFNREDIAALKLLISNPNPSLGLDERALESLSEAVFNAAHGQRV